MNRVLNAVLTHHTPEEVAHLLNWWTRISPADDILIVHGGAFENFQNILHPHKVFIDDPLLRVKPMQEKKQSYVALMRTISKWMQRTDFSHIYLAEYDHLPLTKDLNKNQIAFMETDRADVLAHGLHREDETNAAHYLYHKSDPNFSLFWEQNSIRETKSIVLSMLGTGSFWKRDAWNAVALYPKTVPCYLELYIPTLAHHLGYRVRDWQTQNQFVTNLPSQDITIENARKHGAWTVHPIKNAFTQYPDF